MRRIFSAALALWAVFTPGAWADQTAVPDRPVVVELFTSEGCSSCPPADDLLGELTRHPGVIALAYHVDYWDYIGWKDAFAKPEFTARQKAYAVAAGNRSVYTPQMIVEGVDRVVGFKPKQVADLIRDYQAQPRAVPVRVRRDGDALTIHAVSMAPFAAPATVELVRYLPEQRVPIKRGENAGRTLDYHNIVTEVKTLGTWDGKAPYDARITISGDTPAVVLVQEEGPGRILGAGEVR